MMHQFRLLLKKSSLFIVLACMTTQYTQPAQYTTKQRLIGGFVSTFAGVAGAFGGLFAVCGASRVLGYTEFHFFPPSQTECHQIFERVKETLDDDTSDHPHSSTRKLFEKLVLCHMAYGIDKIRTKKYTDERKYDDTK